MAALSPEERVASQRVFEQYNPDQDEGQTVAPWTRMTPLQVVRSAFNDIRRSLSSPDVGREFDDYLELQEDEIRFYYNEPTTQNHPLADTDMIRFGEGTEGDQNKLDRAIYYLVMGIDSAKVRGRDLTSVKRVGLSKNLPEDVESVMGKFITGKKGSTKAQMDKLHQETDVSLAPRAGGRSRRRRRTQRGGIPPPGGEPRLTIGIPRPAVPGPRAESGAQAPRPRGGRKTRRSRK
jgi:hypothetical protein